MINTPLVDFGDRTGGVVVGSCKLAHCGILVGGIGVIGEINDRANQIRGIPNVTDVEAVNEFELVVPTQVDRSRA